MTFVLGKVPCIRCGHDVWWDRVGSSWVLMEGNRRHACSGIRLLKPEPVADEICGAWMKIAGEHCGRGRNHRGCHRRRTVMDEEAARRRTGRMAA